VESAWPVYGSVLIDRETAYFAAGRHSDVDGGVLLYAASPKTGKTLWQTRLDVDSLPATYMAPGNISNDILVSNGKTIFMRKVGFDAVTGSLSKERASFWSGTGGSFVTDIVQPIVGWHDLNFRRWRHNDFKTKGLTLAIAGPRIFGVRTVGEKKKPWKVHGYEIFSSSMEGGTKQMLWQTPVPQGLVPKAILHAGTRLYAAAVNESDGPTKGVILIYAAKDGLSLGNIPLDAIPKFDGLAAVNGSLIVVDQDGKVIRLAKD
jgi:outer membrane protein assembly factor BamB